MTTARNQEKSALEMKIALLHRGWSVADLSRHLSPPRPRSTVSQAIHHPRRFPRVRAQIITTLWK
jgi:hypothetical protein